MQAMSLRPNLRNLDLNLLVLFDAIMRTRQLTEAANQVGVTQSAASQALARLRHKFNDELFIRHRQGMMPTPTASTIAPAISEALFLIDNMLTQTNDFDPASSHREFCLAFGVSGEPGLLTTILGAASKQAKNIKIKVKSGSIQDALDATVRGEIDFFFDYSPPLNSKLSYIEVAQEEMVVIASLSHPRLKKSISKDDFFSEKHILITLSDDHRAVIENILQDNGKRRKAVAEVNNYHAIPSMVAESEAIATVPQSLTNIGFFSQRLKVMPMPFTLPKLPLYLVWHSSLSSDPAHKWLKDLIIDHMKDKKGQ